MQITDSNASDTFYDLMFLDNAGQTVLINEGSGGYVTYFIDEPDPKYDLGLHLGSQGARYQAISVMDAVQALAGGPLTLQPGDNKLLAWSLSGAPEPWRSVTSPAGISSESNRVLWPNVEQADVRQGSVEPATPRWHPGAARTGRTARTGGGSAA